MAAIVIENLSAAVVAELERRAANKHRTVAEEAGDILSTEVQTELQRAAEAAGFDRVIPRSAFTKHLPEILSGMDWRLADRLRRDNFVDRPHFLD